MRIIPAFVTEDFAVNVDEDGVICENCPLDEVDPNEQWDYVAKLAYFGWLDFMFFVRLKGMRPYAKTPL